MQLLPDGKYWDVIEKADGSLIDYGWRSNIIVDQCRELLAAFMLGGTALGIQRLSLGRGEDAWDGMPAPEPNAGTSSLTDASPVSISAGSLQLDFIDATGGVSATPTHRIEITLTLTPGTLPISGDEVFPMREFALFGQLGGADCMIDYVRHPVMNIAADDTLTRRIRLVF